MTYTRIGTRPVGPGHPVLVVAEIGSNHNRDLDMALRLIDTAADAGCDAVKFQHFTAADLYTRSTPQFSYLESVTSAPTWEVIREAELPKQWQRTLMQHAEQRGLAWFSTPTDRRGVDELDALGVPAFKVSGYEAVDTPLLRYVASKGRPVIVSTGMCTDAEVAEIVAACRAEGNEQVVLLQCTSLYPAPARLANLRAIERMAHEYGVPVGLSDHTPGIHIPVAAVALGACVIEKHITLDRTLPGPDHPFAIEPGELRAMVAQIREVESALGDGLKCGPAPEEAEMYTLARRSVVSRCVIPAGTVITEGMVTTKRPGYGIPARRIGEVVGKPALRDIPADEVLTWEMIG